MKVKKLVSFVLVAAMMLSVFVLPATAVNENEVVVHYYNENNWENPYIYYYNDGNTPVNWPGVAMNSDGDNWYSYTINNMGTAKVIFSNNGADQYPAQNQEGLTVSGEKWYKSGSFYSQNPDLSKITVHYYNTTAWSNPYIYYYTDSANPITWPGVAMTSDGNGWYSYNIYGYDSAKVIFSDNGSNQNPGQNEPGYSVSGEKWYVNGSFYDSEPNGITVHFYNYDNWNNVNLYYYSGNLEGTNWTGNPMFADGDGWYSYKIYGLDEARVLFNNGSGIQIPGVMEEGFLVSDEMWYRNGTWTDERPDEITVYFYKPDNWSTANIYYYLNDNDTGPAWPGTTMTEVSDGWYAYHITKYASAKVMFNDSNNQIPAQNQPGLDASGVMWYKNGVWCDSETDTDEDELPDYMELILGTNINNTDTDNDSLPDGFEVLTLGTDPLKPDSDDNGTNDANEDADSDGLTNLREYQLGTEPLDEDTDKDGLTDGDEINIYFTDPKDEDTDDDTLSDSDDVALGFSPLLPDTDANGVLDCDEKIFQTLSEEISESDKPEVTDVTVSFSGTGNIHTNTTIKSIYNVDILSSNVVGLVGAPVEIETSSDFDTATITFTYDPSELGSTDEDDLSVMWYDEENDVYILQTSTVDTINHKVSATVTHFSKYMLVDKLKWFQAWSQPIDYMNGNSVYFDTVIAIDCSGSMSWNDPFFDYTYTDSLTGNSQTINTCYRILAGKNYINAKKDDDKIAIVTFESSSTVQCNLTNSKSTAITALNSVYSSGGTNFESAISSSINLLNGVNDSNNKTILLLSDGESSISEATLDNAVSSHIRINTVYIGSDDDNELMEEIADVTGGEYFKATTAEELMKVYDFIARTQGIDTDDIDIDGLYDVYERNGMRLSNGEVVYTDPTDSDSDNDGLLDGEEIKQEVKTVPSIMYSPFNLNNQYPPFETQIVFTKYSDPHNIDSDNDGMLDGRCTYKTGKVVLPADNKPMEKHPMSDVLKMQDSSMSDNSLSTNYTEQPKFDLNVTVDTIINGVNGILGQYNGELIPGREILAHSLIDMILYNRDSLKNLYPIFTTVVKSIKAINGIVWSNDTAAWVSAEVGAYILNFSRVNNSGTTFHARPDTWQKDYGYNVFYDDVFEVGSYMRIGMNYFEYDDNSDGTNEDYLIWAWRGDYWNLGAGCEVGVYKYDRTVGNEDHYNASPFNLPMSLNMYELPDNGVGSIQSAFHWYPNDDQWWITGFDYSRQSPNPSRLVTVGYIDLSDYETIYNSICGSENLQNNKSLDPQKKLYPYLISDDQNKFIWFVWYD